MFVGIARAELHLPAARSLKDKRQVVRSLKDRLRDRALAAVAEVDYHDLWQRTALGIAVVAADAGQAQELLQVARRLADAEVAAVLTDWQERIE